MTDETGWRHDAVEALVALLEAERAALLAGDFERLIGMLDDKAALIDQLDAADDLTEDMLHALRTRLERNQALLDSALAGIRGVAGRIGALHRMRRSLDTYDQTGRRTTIEGSIDHVVERRA
ncbi:MAG: FlgN protein [Rhodobacteraceae bacterium HLUCCO07]|nr:MAG: FlgN protein [Rhodobacteraceae bacterium HLUCCO07]